MLYFRTSGRFARRGRGTGCRAPGRFVEPFEPRVLLSASVEPRGLTADRFESNNSLATATNFGVLGNREEADLSIHASRDVDYFRFSAAATGHFLSEITFDATRGDLDYYLLDAEGEVLYYSEGETDSEVLFGSLIEGETYYLQVIGFEGSRNPQYDLTFTGPPGEYPLDRFEFNDFTTTATDLGALGSRTEAGLTIDGAGDYDLFRFTAAADGQLTANVLFSHAQGDIDVALYRPEGDDFALVGFSQSEDDNESVTTAVAAGDEYYLMIFGYGGAANPDYTLMIDGPVPADLAPTVTGVYLNGTAWTPAFRAHLADAGQGDAALGFALPAGAGQLDELPWTNADQVSIRFSEPVVVGQEDLQVLGVAVPNYAVAGFAYDHATFTATWALASPFAADKVLLVLDADAASGGVADGAGLPLDGEWSSGVTATFPSGNGAPGGDFLFRMNILPGDVNRSGGIVNAQDVVQVRNRQFTSTSIPGTAPTTYSIFHDVNGTGNINAQDVVLVRNRQFTGLPAGEPVAPAGEEATPGGVVAPKSAKATPRSPFSIRPIRRVG